MRYIKSRFEANGGISEDIKDLGKYIYRDRDEAVTTGSALAYAKAGVHRLTSKLDGVRKLCKGSKTNHRDSADRANAAAGRRGTRLRGYTISWRRQRDKGTVSSEISKSCGAYWRP